MEHRSKLFLVTALFLFLQAGAVWAAESVEAIANYKGADREQKLIAGAKKEGSLMLYGTLTVPDMQRISQDFGKRYGVKLTFWRASSEDVVQRSSNEWRAGRHAFDVIETNGPELEMLQREGMFAPMSSPYFDQLLKGSVRPHRQWTAIRLNLFVQGYNTNLIKESDLPKSYSDLADPKWGGKLAVEAGDVDWFATLVQALGEQKGLDLFRKMAQNGLQVRKGHTLMAGLLGSGEIPMALSLYSHNVDKAKAKGAPVAWFTMPPAVARPNGIGVSAQPPHPYAAVLFFDYMLTDGQKILAKAHYIPTNKSLKSPLNKIKDVVYVDPKTVLDEFSKWSKLYDQIVVQKAK